MHERHKEAPRSTRGPPNHPLTDMTVCPPHQHHATPGGGCIATRPTSPPPPSHGQQHPSSCSLVTSGPPRPVTAMPLPPQAVEHGSAAFWPHAAARTNRLALETTKAITPLGMPPLSTRPPRNRTQHAAGGRALPSKPQNAVSGVEGGTLPRETQGKEQMEVVAPVEGRKTRQREPLDPMQRSVGAR